MRQAWRCFPLLVQWSEAEAAASEAIALFAVNKNVDSLLLAARSGRLSGDSATASALAAAVAASSGTASSKKLLHQAQKKLAQQNRGKASAYTHCENQDVLEALSCQLHAANKVVSRKSFSAAVSERYLSR